VLITTNEASPQPNRLTATAPHGSRTSLECHAIAFGLPLNEDVRTVRSCLLLLFQLVVNLRRLVFRFLRESDGREEIAGPVDRGRFARENVFLLVDGAEEPADLPFRENIQRRIEAVLKVAREDDLVLIAFSGHGVADDALGAA
jgi:hypothetical protein